MVPLHGLALEGRLCIREFQSPDYAFVRTCTIVNVEAYSPSFHHSQIGAKNIWISIFILIGMLVVIVLAIHCQGWRLTKLLGGLMFLMYFAFLAVAIVLELPFETCETVV